MSDNKERCNFKNRGETTINYAYKERVILIYLYKKYNGNYLLVGGSNDCAIFNNLEYDWIEE